MKKRKLNYTIIELLVSTGIFMMMMVLVLRFYSTSQSFVQRSTEVSRHIATQALAMRFINADLKYLCKTTHYDLSDPANPTISNLPITEVVAGEHYRFYSNSIDEVNQQSGEPVAISLKLQNGQLLRSARKITDMSTLPLTTSDWSTLEQNNTALLADDVSDFSINFYSDVTWSGSQATPVAATKTGGVLNSFPKAIGITLSTAKVITSSNSAAVQATEDRTKQTISTIIYP